MIPNREVEIRFFGALASQTGKKLLRIELSRPLPLGRLLKDLESESLKTLEEDIWGRRNILVLVNDREIEVLEGRKTIISPGDKIALLPVSHGGGV